jgi:16S rRNA (guanine527-N7)-methyltransferase
VTTASSPRERRRPAAVAGGEASVPATRIVTGAAQLGLDLSAAQGKLLQRHCELLLKWNAVHNLTAIRATDEVLTHHLLDSLAIVPVIARLAGARSVHVLDVGSGGGLPGIALAIAWPSAHVTLLDKVRKKSAFAAQVRLELALSNVEVAHARVEDFRPERPFDLVVARALASLRDFVTWTAHLLAPGGLWVAMKGSVPAEELAELPAGVRVRDVIALRVPGLHAQRHLIILEPTAKGSDPE